VEADLEEGLEGRVADAGADEVRVAAGSERARG
jgi:hypothetical protein